MQYTYQTIVNFISDSVMPKFLRFAHAKFSNRFFTKMRGRNRNFDFKFEFMYSLIYIDFTDDLHENKNCVGVQRYIQ